MVRRYQVANLCCLCEPLQCQPTRRTRECGHPQDACEAGSEPWRVPALDAAVAAMTDAVTTCYGPELSPEQVTALASRDAAAS